MISRRRPVGWADGSELQHRLPDDEGEPWEASCDDCGERIDLDHYYDMVAHDEMHWEERQRELALAAKGGARHRLL